MTITVQRWTDAAAWNRYVASRPEAHFQQSWEWGELGPELGNRAVRLAAIDHGEMVGAMQVFVSPVSKLNRTYLYVPRGPVVAAPRTGLLGALFDGARQVGLEEGSVGIKVEPNVPATDSEWPRILRALGFHPSFPPSQPRSAWMLDITPEADTLLANMKQKTRYNIRLAARKGVQVVDAGEDQLDEFYTLYRETAERDDFFIHGKDLYRRMFSLFGQMGDFAMLFACFEGKPIAAVTLLRFGSTCWYVHGASSNAHRNLMAPYLLQWEAIQRAKEWGCTLYDFRAVPDVLEPDQDMFGVYRFKEGFGGYHFTTLPTFAAPYQPIPFNLWQTYFASRFALDAWRRKRAGLPARQFA